MENPSAGIASINGRNLESIAVKQESAQPSISHQINLDILENSQPGGRPPEESYNTSLVRSPCCEPFSPSPPPTNCQHSLRVRWPSWDPVEPPQQQLHQGRTRQGLGMWNQWQRVQQSRLPNGHFSCHMATGSRMATGTPRTNARGMQRASECERSESPVVRWCLRPRTSGRTGFCGLRAPRAVKAWKCLPFWANPLARGVGRMHGTSTDVN